MAVSFNTIPQDVRVPLFYAEMDNSQANSFTQSQRTLLIGQMLTTGQATAGELTLVTRTDEAKQLFATGSMLARMYEAARKNDPIGEIWCIPLADDGAASEATGKITITGTATESGTLSVYIAGQLVKGVVVSGDDQATIAASLITAINANANLPVTAAVNGSNDNEVDLTSKWKGETANDIKLMLNYYRAVGGESTPAGLTVGLTAMSGGATNPSLATAITVMGDEEYDFIIQPYTDSANLN
jgi:phage tail sheath gpL-like